MFYTFFIILLIERCNMAQTVSVNFKLDAEVKKAMEKVCKEMGLSMSAAFTIFAKKLAKNIVFLLKYLQTHFILNRILQD